MGFHQRLIEKGSGPAVVFSHGTLMDATMFEPQLDHLAERGYRAIAYNSHVLTAEPAAHTVGDLVEDCRTLMDDLGIGTCVLAGMSVGGFMALEFAVAYPERLQRADRHRRHLEGLFGPRNGRRTTISFDKLDIDGTVPRDFAEWVAPFCFGETTMACNETLVAHWIERWATTMPARAQSTFRAAPGSTRRTRPNASRPCVCLSWSCMAKKTCRSPSTAHRQRRTPSPTRRSCAFPRQGTRSTWSSLRW